MTADLPRQQSSFLFQLHTGHVPLNQHLHQIKQILSLTCPYCQGEVEMLMHFIQFCPVYAAQCDTLLLRGLHNQISSSTHSSVVQGHVEF